MTVLSKGFLSEESTLRCAAFLHDLGGLVIQAYPDSISRDELLALDYNFLGGVRDFLGPSDPPEEDSLPEEEDVVIEEPDEEPLVPAINPNSLESLSEEIGDEIEEIPSIAIEQVQETFMEVDDLDNDYCEEVDPSVEEGEECEILEGPTVRF